MTGDDSDSQGWVPVPDPTERTRLAAAAEAAQLRRELAAGIAKVEARLDAMDVEWERHLQFAKEIRPQAERIVGHLKDLHDERFAGIEQRFTDRDARAKDAAIANKDALINAFASAEKLNTLMSEHFKAEIQSLKSQAAERGKSVDQQLAALTKSIDQGVPSGFIAGERAQKTERRLDSGAQLAWIVAAILMASLIVTIIVATRPRG